MRENLLVACDDQDLARYGVDLVHPGDRRCRRWLPQRCASSASKRDLDAMPDTLPHGRRRLVAIARAVAASRRRCCSSTSPPRASRRSRPRNWVGSCEWLAHDVGLAVLMIEHDVGLVLSVCDRVAVLDFGRLIALGPPAEIGDRPRRRRRLPRSTGVMLDARDLTIGYGDVPVVHGIDLYVGAGEVVALLGPNGAGKTTTLLALAGVLPATGEVRFDERPLTGRLHRRSKRGLGLIPEERAVFRQLSTRTNLALGAGGVDGALAVFPELERLLDRNAGLLSGGEQQMLVLARALAARPRLLLIDELSLGLAPLIVTRLLAAVREAAGEGMGVLLVEQHARQALESADRAYVLLRGRIEIEGTGAELLARLPEIERTYLGGLDVGSR